MPQGRYIVVTGPSASGKTAVVSRILEQETSWARLVTTTTREPRPGEVDGRDYHFVTPETFRRLREQGDFLEWAENYGNFYGSSRTVLDEMRGRHPAVFGILDVKGALIIKELLPEAVTLFLKSTEDELRRRIAERPGTGPEELERRLAVMCHELGLCDRFDHAVVNADGRLDDTADSVISIVRSRIGAAW